MNELALFAGAGGGILGGVLLGWHTVAAVELERYPRELLLQRQRDGILPPFPVWDDVRTFDGKPWRGIVDVVSGGFPCQDISAAGKGAGITGARSGLWVEMHRVICEVRPRYAFMENSPLLTSRGLHRVLGDLAEAGYNAAWMVLGAADLGAPHKRDRIWILAEDSRRRDVLSHSNMLRSGRRQQFQEGSPQEARVSPLDSDSYGMQCTEQRKQYDRPEESARGGKNRVEPGRFMAHSMQQWQGRQQCSKEMETTPTHSDLSGREKQREPESTEPQQQAAECGGWWDSEPALGRVAHGVAHRVDRLKSIGNGQVPAVAAVAFRTLQQRLDLYK